MNQAVLFEKIVFYAITAIVVFSAFFAVLARNIVHAAFALFFTFLGMAGYYALLGADFLAVTQIVIYVGGILVLLIFGIMLTHRNFETLKLEHRRNFILGGLVGLIVFFILLYVIFFSFWAAPSTSTLAPPQPTTKIIGQLLLTDYLLPFELSSITLLMALIGAIYLVRRRDQK